MTLIDRFRNLYEHIVKVLFSLSYFEENPQMKYSCVNMLVYSKTPYRGGDRALGWLDAAKYLFNSVHIWRHLIQIIELSTDTEALYDTEALLKKTHK